MVISVVVAVLEVMIDEEVIVVVEVLAVVAFAVVLVVKTLTEGGSRTFVVMIVISVISMDPVPAVLVMAEGAGSGR